MSKLFKEISNLATEQRNPNSSNIDISSTTEILEIINQEDKKVAESISEIIPDIAICVDKIVEAFRNGGRLIYFGAGTSGRLGILDAAECPPTFGSSPEMVQAFIAGGASAVFQAVEGAEDSMDAGANDVLNSTINSNDVVCGIAASGRTPYVKGALAKARELGAWTILISTVGKSKILELEIDVDMILSANVGPEILTGSTRMKSGTAQKLILNMLSTASMIKLGKTYSNVMIDLQLKNAKLVERAKGTIMNLCEVDYQIATEYLDKANGHVKTAILMLLANVEYQEAKALLENNDGFVKKAIIQAKS
jgi:N-acetylmuramic acid 6-phosphate etherase